MANEYMPIDITNDPAQLKLAEEVRKTNCPRVLKPTDEDIAVIAVIAPIKKTARRSALRRKSAADMDASWSSLAPGKTWTRSN